MKNSQLSRPIPRMQRLIVTLGGAAIFFETLLFLLRNALDIAIPDVLVEITAFVLGGLTAAWLMHMLHNHDSDNN